MEYSERELDIPVLRLLRDNIGGLTTTQLIEMLERQLQPTDHDADIITNRSDTYFSQKVRNLISHRESRTSLVSRELVTYDPARHLHKITSKGLDHLEEFEPIIEGLKLEGHNPTNVKLAIKRNYEDIILEAYITEGLQSSKTVKHRQRSRKLRDEKVKELKQTLNGRVACIACGFDFSETYDGHGQDYIEIHHLEPVHLMDVNGNTQKLLEALRKVVPLCSNCHRMVHKKRDKPLTIEKLKKIIEENRSD